jgi:hypothetical protein
MPGQCFLFSLTQGPLVGYLTLRSVLSLSNPQNNEMKICEKFEFDMLKIIMGIVGYTLNDFTIHVTISL